MQITKFDIVTIIILAIPLITILNLINKEINIRQKRANIKLTIYQLEGAVKMYYFSEDAYPPDKENNGGQEEGETFKYRNDILVKYLGGISDSKKNKFIYYEFREENINKKNKFIYTDNYFNTDYWYHNFHDNVPKLRKIIINDKKKLHPWYNAIFYNSFQIYNKANGRKKEYSLLYKPYSIKKQKHLVWITNYSENYTPFYWEWLTKPLLMILILSVIIYFTVNLKYLKKLLYIYFLLLRFCY